VELSEYQYYEFQAVDRPLTQQEMAELRALSTRATIKPTRFQNVYHYGDFKGDPLAVLERYFDAYLYVANWGTHLFMLRLPERLMDQQTAQSYAIDGSLDVHGRVDVVILAFTSTDDEGSGWIQDDEAASWMPALLPLRAELASGDLRTLYLGWLAGAEAGKLDDEEVEPPVPPRLDRLSPPLKSLAEFLRISDDLLDVAAATSAGLPGEPSADDIEHWIATLPLAEKDGLLNRLVTGNESHLRAEIIRRVRTAKAPRLDASAGIRSVGELLAKADEQADVRRRQAAEREASERARLERERADARSKYFSGLIGQEDQLWQRIDALTDAKRPKEYDQAVELLKDLHELSVLYSSEHAFAARLAALRDRCAKRPSLIDRLNRAGLQA
jgi:hypothetical protein